MQLILDGLQRSGNASAEVVAQLAQRYGLAGQAAQQAAQQIAAAARTASQAWANVQMPGGPGIGGNFGGGLSSFLASGAGGQGGGASDLGGAARVAAEARNQFGGLAEDFRQVAPAADQAAAGVRGLAAATETVGTASRAAAEGTERAASSTRGLGDAFGFSGGLASQFFTFLKIDLMFQLIGALEQGAGAVVHLGEAWQTAGQRIENVLHVSTSQAGQLRDELAALSKGVPLESTFTLASQVGPALRDRGYGLGDLEKIIQTLNQLAVVSGTTGDQASRAFYQLSQAFALGRLQGQDLRILIEDMPPLFVALSEATGKTQGQLEQMAHAGQLTTDVLAGALLKVAPDVSAEFAQMGDNVSHGLADVGNAFEIAAGRANDTTGFVANLGGALEQLAQSVNGGLVGVALTGLAAMFGDVAKAAGLVLQAGNMAVKAVSGPDLSSIQGKVDQANRLIEQAKAAQKAADSLGADTIAQAKAAQKAADSLGADTISPNYEGPTDRRARERAQVQAQTDAFDPRELDEARNLMAQANAQAQAQRFAADSTAVKPPDDQLAKDLDARVAKGKELVDLQSRLDQLTQMYDDDVAIGGVSAEKLAAISAERVATEQKLQAAQKGQDVQKIVDQQHVSLEEAQKRYNLMNQENQGLDTIASTQAKIRQLEADRAVFPEKSAQINQLIAQQQQHLQELEDRRAKTAQSHADAIANQRNALLAQEGPEAALLAAEEKIARARQGGVLTSDAQVTQASAGAFEKYANAIADQAAKQAAGQSERIRLQAQINALLDAEQRHGEARLQVEDRLNTVRAALVALDQKDVDALDKQAAANDRVLSKLQAQLQALTHGGGDIQARIGAAGQAAADQIKLPTAEQQASPNGAQYLAEAQAKQADARATAELVARMQVQHEALRALNDPMLNLKDQLGTLDDELRAGVITWQQWSAASQRAIVQAAQQARQQHITDLFNTGDPASGAPVGRQALAGLEAGGLQLEEQFGNVSKAIGQGLTDAFGQGADALTTFLTTGKADFRAMIASILTDLTKLAIEYTIIAAVRAAAGIGGGAAAPAGPTSLFPGIFHQGGMVGEAGPSRLVSPLLFAGAPRAAGGLNLAGGEVPIIAHRGERVLNPAETAAYNRGGGGTSISMTIHVDARGGTDPGALEAAATRGAQAGAAQALARVNRSPALRAKVVGR